MNTGKFRPVVTVWSVTLVEVGSSESCWLFPEQPARNPVMTTAKPTINRRQIGSISPSVS